MRRIYFYIKTVSLSLLVFVPTNVFADTFNVISPIATSVVREGQELKISWTGEVNGPIDSSGKISSVMSLTIVPVALAINPLGIGVVNINTHSFIWQVPSGLREHFAGAAYYRIEFNRGGTIVRSPTFSLISATSSLAYVDAAIANATKPNDLYKTSYTPYLSVGANGVYDPNGTANSIFTDHGTNKYGSYSTAYNTSTATATASTSVVGGVSSTSSVDKDAKFVYMIGCLDLASDMYFGVKDRSEDVLKLQQFLINQKLLNAGSTGYFGVLTQAAVKEFQTQNSISGTGYAGSLTRGKIKSLTCSLKNDAK